MQLAEHPTVKQFQARETASKEVARPQTLDRDWLRQMCLEAGADDVGFVEIDRPELTHVFGREMANRGHGRILLVASVLGYQAVPGYAAYAASKGYVLLLGEALHQELAARGVSVTTVSPGTTATAFGAVAGENSSLLLKALRMKPHVVAKTALLAAMRDKASVVPGFLNKVNVFTDRLMPRSMQRMVFGRVMAG